MSSVKPKGGRGKKAPYETKVLRVPVALEDAIDEVCDQYRLAPEKFGVPDRISLCPSSDNQSLKNSDIDELLKAARCILREKKTPKQSLKKLLQVIFDDDSSKEKIDSF